MSSFKTLDDLPADLTGQVALVRVDLNLPMKDGAATDVTRVEAAKPTILELTEKGAKVLLLAHFGRERGQLATRSADIIDACHAFHLLARMHQQIVGHQPDLGAHQFAQLPVTRGVGKAPLDRAPLVRQPLQRQQVVQVEEAGAQPVVDVVVVISDIIGNRRDLRLERRPAVKVERESAIDFGQCPARLEDRTIVLGQPFQRFPRQV